MNCLDHFAVDPVITPMRATGHQLVTLCRSVCAEERAQILDPLMGSKYVTMFCYSILGFFSSLYSLIHRIRCRASTFGAECCTSGPHVVDTSGSSADESQAGHSRRRVRSKRTVKMKNV